MNAFLQRALLLYDQSRYEMAEAEIRHSLASEPEDAFAHALLALCLARRERLEEATEEARRAVHLAPDLDFAHYAHATVLFERNRLDEAAAAVQEALRLSPDDADAYALLAQVRLGQRDWAGALEAAERGLRSASDHVGCTNLRAMALVKLGRKAEAGATIDAALARDPDDALTHANQGWTLLERRDPKKALEHFREALRLDPTSEWARAGIVEALKARNPVYALLLRYFLWMAKLSPGAQWGVILGGYVLNRLLVGLSDSHPALAPWLLPLRILYLAFVVLSWTAMPLFNLLLRVNRFGRLALSDEQRTASTWFGVTVLLALGSLGLCLPFGFQGIFLPCALVFGFLMVPVAASFQAPRGWPRRFLSAYTGFLLLAGLTWLVSLLPQGWRGPLRDSATSDLGHLAFQVFLWGSVAFLWIANFVMQADPKR